jgi:myo-inositol-1(or 4)-monophosphatase
MSRSDDLARIVRAIDAAVEIFRPFTPGSVDFEHKPGGDDPVTEADRAVNDALKQLLHRDGEGWLSEETVDDPSRLGKSRVWIVDPLDGTREFVAGIPEWCVSIGLIEDGKAVAGGICNPATRETIVGSIETGVTLNGVPARARARSELNGALVLASRSEVKRGEWQRFESAPFTTRAMGSVAYKLSLVAAGLADATWTLVPKHEWDVAAGVALVRAAGGEVHTLDGSRPVFNQRKPLLRGLVATGPGLAAGVGSFLGLAVGGKPWAEVAGFREPGRSGPVS